MSSTDWIQVGADVVAYTNDREDGIRGRNVRRSRIEKVNRKTFRIEGEATLYELDTQAIREGGTWSPTRHVVPADSEAGRAELAGMRRRNRTRAAKTAVDEWRKTPSRDTVLAAIKALENTLVDHPHTEKG